jgi:hypothetical protein
VNKNNRTHQRWQYHKPSKSTMQNFILETNHKKHLLTSRTGSPVLIRACGRANFDSKGVLGLTSWTSSHSSRDSILTVPWSGWLFFILRSLLSWSVASCSFPQKQKIRFITLFWYPNKHKKRTLFNLNVFFRSHIDYTVASSSKLTLKQYSRILMI